MQHPSKPLAKTRQGTLAGSAEQGFISGAAFRTPRRPWACCAGAPQPAARWQGYVQPRPFRRQLAGH